MFDTVSVHSVLEVSIDNNGIDPLVDIPGAYEAALAAIEGRPENLVRPHDIVGGGSDTR